MKKQKNKGYSLIVLVIAIIVMIILSGAAISSLRTSRQKTEIQNFIFDLNSMEEKVQSYYVLNGSLPTSSKEAIDIALLATKLDYPDKFMSQLSLYDNDNYYYIDVARLGGVALRNPYRGMVENEHGYIVNEGSLKVYVEKGVPYTIDGSNEEEIYYTLTSNLVDGQEEYNMQDEEIKIAGNPLSWTNKAELRVVLPRQSLSQTEWDAWTFKWDFGPKSAEELRLLPEKNTFKYGDKLIVKSNGVYSIYCRAPGTNGKETVINVNVNKIDNIEPRYIFLDGGDRISFVDDETGLKAIKYITLAQYLKNVAEAEAIETDNLEARTRNDYFLMNGSGDNLMINLGAQIIEFANRKETINNQIKEENDEWAEIQEEYDNSASDPEVTAQHLQKLQAHNDIIASLNMQLLELANQYPYLADIYGTTNDSRLVVYAEDYSGNATTVGVTNTEVISTMVLANSYNISLAPLQ